MTDDTRTRQRFAAAMIALYKAFWRDPDKDVSNICFVGLQHLSIEDTEAVISLAIQNEDRFPTVHALRRYVSMIPTKPLPKIEYKVNTYGENLAEVAMTMVSAINAGKLTRNKIIEGMELFDKQFPGIRWREESAHLAAHYSRDER